MHEQELFLPPALPGETLYSQCARAAAWSRMSTIQASHLLLGHGRGSTQFDLLTGLRQLACVHARAGQSLETGEMTLRLRTAVGASLPFMDVQRRRVLVDLAQEPRGISRSRGNIARDLDQESRGLALRRCPDCVAEDLRLYQLTYWHTAHQFPGIWLCPWHARPLQWLVPTREKLPAWELAQQPIDRFREVRLEANWMEPLLLTSYAVLWCTDQQSLGTFTLAALIRARLHAAGLIGVESKLGARDCERIDARVSAPLRRAGLPHFPRPSSPAWVLKLLNARDYSQPLGWAVLLASTLPKGFAVRLVSRSEWPLQHRLPANAMTMGICESSELDRDLALATARACQLSLFKDRYGVRLSGAPERLYSALGCGVRLSVAAQFSSMSLGECQRWIQRDPVLRARWHGSIAALRTQEARSEIERFLEAHPDAMRSEVLRVQNRAVRSLARHAPQLLDQLLPEVQQKYSRQRYLFPGVF